MQLVRINDQVGSSKGSAIATRTIAEHFMIEKGERPDSLLPVTVINAILNEAVAEYQRIAKEAVILYPLKKKAENEALEIF